MHTSHSNCQTDEQFDEAVQTAESSCAATQTEAEEDPGLKEACTVSLVGIQLIQVRNFLLSASQTMRLTKSAVVALLLRISITLCLLGKFCARNTIVSVNAKFVFKFDGLDQKQDTDPEQIDQSVTSIDWNATGSIIVAGYGQRVHSGWGTGAKAGCALWNIFSRDFNPSEPRLFLPTESCVMSVACHPELPAVIAAGTFNGEIVVWDTSIEDERPMMIASTRIDDYFHREAVVSLKWIYDDSEIDNYLLVSESGEGKVLFWSLSNNCLVPLMDIYCKQSENPKEAAAKKILLAVQQCPSKVEASFKLGRMNELVKPFLSVLNTALHLLLDLKVGNFFAAFCAEATNPCLLNRTGIPTPAIWFRVAMVKIVKQLLDTSIHTLGIWASQIKPFPWKPFTNHVRHLNSYFQILST